MKKPNEWIVTPTLSYSNPPPVYVRVDQDAGCLWGLVIHRCGDALFVLTPAGIRYYGFLNEWEPNLVTPDHADYDTARSAWQRSLATLP